MWEALPYPSMRIQGFQSQETFEILDAKSCNLPGVLKSVTCGRVVAVYGHLGCGTTSVPRPKMYKSRHCMPYC